MIFNRTMAALQEELMAKYVVSSTIRHKGEKGRQREHGLVLFLREHLPLAYGVATGEITTSYCYTVTPLGEEVSPQCDIILYDQINYPILGKSDPVQQVPIDAVYAVIEVKSSIDSAELKDAREKFKLIASMHDTFRKARKLPRSRDHLPAFVLFGYRSSASAELMTPQPGGYDDFYVVALDKGIGIITDPGKKSERRGVWMTTEDHPKRSYQTLAWFFFLLLYGMQSEKPPKPDYSFVIQ